MNLNENLDIYIGRYKNFIAIIVNGYVCISAEKNI